MNNKKKLAGLLTIAMLLFLFFNFSTTLESLQAIFGVGAAITSFSIAVSAVDFAGLAGAFLYAISKDENGVVQETDSDKELRHLLMGAWLISIIGDVFLTWLWGMIKFEANTASSSLSTTLLADAGYIAPIVLALAEAALRITLVILVSRQYRNIFKNEAAQYRTSRRTQRPSSGTYNRTIYETQEK